MANKKTHYRFKLSGGKTPASWQLPLKGLMLLKKDDKGNELGLKKVAYVKGHDSIFVEDQKGDEKPENIWFEDGVLDVHKQNKALVDILFRHRWFKTHYELVDDAVDAKKKLSKYELIEKANIKLNVSNPDELRAIGIILLGGHTLEWEESRIKAGLKEIAYNDPNRLLDEMSQGDYHAKFTGALALLKGIVVINPSRTGVTWEDGKTIVKVPAGQDPMTKLGQFLSSTDEQAVITLQEIGERTTRAYKKKVVPDVEKLIKEVENEKAKELSDKDDDGDALQEARDLYKELYEKDVPPNMKNKIEWILEKIEEADSDSE